MDKGKEARRLIREFDTKLLAAREYDGWLYQMPCYFLELLFIMISFVGEEAFMLWFGIMGYAFSISLELRGYLKFQGQSVYELLSYYPVRKKDIFWVRLGYLKDKLLKRFLLLYVIQLPWIIYYGDVTKNNIVIPLWLMLVAFLFCILEMLPGIRMGEEK